MKELNVRIVQLEPLRVASFHAYDEQPEELALEQLAAWAEPRGFLDNPGEHRVFGFNHPSPSPGSPKYGYEFWMGVGPEIQADGEIEIKQFAGGLYAVACCKVGGKPYETIPACWKQLVLWQEDSPYRRGSHQWLEEPTRLNEFPRGEWDLDLYLPIVK